MPAAATGGGLEWLWWLLPAGAGVALAYTVWWYFRRRPPGPGEQA